MTGNLSFWFLFNNTNSWCHKSCKTDPPSLLVPQRKIYVLKSLEWTFHVFFYLCWLNHCSSVWRLTLVKSGASACVCVCLYTSTVETSSVFNDVPDILCCGHYTRYFCQVHSSPFLNLSFFTSKFETPARQGTEEKIKWHVV